MIAGQLQPAVRTTDIENETRVICRDAGQNLHGYRRTTCGLCDQIEMIRNLSLRSLTCIDDLDLRPEQLRACIDLDNVAEHCLDDVEHVACRNRHEAGAG